jgi:acyl dehydratase
VEKIPFDDIEALRARMSDDFGPFGREIEVTQQMINEFAEVTGDHQWIHLDVERCKRESPFGGPIAHGFLTLSLLPALGAASDEEPEYAIVGAGNAVNYGSDKLRFLSPVPAGAKVASRSRLSAVEAVPKGTRVAREVAVHAVGSDRPALLYSMITLYQPPRK